MPHCERSAAIQNLDHAEDDDGDDTPLGSGIAVMLVWGTACFIGKRHNEG